MLPVCRRRLTRPEPPRLKLRVEAMPGVADAGDIGSAADAAAAVGSGYLHCCRNCRA